MKKVFGVLVLSFLFLFSFSNISFAQEENDKNCIDMATFYEEVNNSSQALTGKAQSFDSIRKTQIATALTDFVSIFVGDSIYCIKDEEAAAKTSAFKSNGIIGWLDNANSSFLSGLPNISVTNHLAQEFVPGYSGNNNALAQYTSDYGSCVREKDVKETEENETDSPSFPSFTVCACGSEPDSDGKKCVPFEEEYAKHYDTHSPAIQREVNEQITNAISQYLGFGKIDFNSGVTEVEDKSGFRYLQDIKLDVLWSITRNIAYLFFVVVMIVIGFMIMFRSKIGGQILVSVGNSIPRLVVCLLLVTFSFAISGIMLDIGKMSMNVVGNLMYDAQKTVEPNKLTTKVDIASFSNLTDQLLYHVDSRNESGSKDDELESIIREKMLKEDRISSDWKGQTGSIMGEIALRWGAAFLMSSAKESEFNPGDIISLIFPRLAKLMESFDLIWDILLVGLQVANYPRLLKLILWLLIALYASVKLFITIVTSYARIFVNVVLGPIQMALGAIPGNFNSVIRWFKSLAANILVFPVIVAILGFSQFLATAVQPQNFVFFGNQGIFIPEGLITIKGVLLVAGYLFAANAPKFVQSFMKVEEDRTLAVVGANIQKSASRMPLLGGVFGAK